MQSDIISRFSVILKRPFINRINSDVTKQMSFSVGKRNRKDYFIL